VIFTVLFLLFRIVFMVTPLFKIKGQVSPGLSR
jgi:hypothetical protein